jgi:hypothetical protein
MATVKRSETHRSDAYSTIFFKENIMEQSEANVSTRRRFLTNSAAAEQSGFSGSLPPVRQRLFIALRYQGNRSQRPTTKPYVLSASKFRKLTFSTFAGASSRRDGLNVKRSMM